MQNNSELRGDHPNNNINKSFLLRYNFKGITCCYYNSEEVFKYTESNSPYSLLLDWGKQELWEDKTVVIFSSYSD